MKHITPEQALALLENCPLAVLLTDADGRVRGCNRSFAALLGEDAGALAGRSSADALLAPLLAQGTLINWILPDGEERWLALETSSIAGLTGEVRFYTDVTEKLRLKRERDELVQALQRQSLQDAEMGSLLSRHGMLVSLRPLVARSRRYNSPLCVVAMRVGSDTDPASARTRIAQLLKDQTRWADLVGCNAQRDFILILQETTRDAAEQLVGKLAGHIERINAAAHDPVQACYGITRCHKNDDEVSLLERAEAALAQACRSPNGTAIAL